eukprot:14904002-Ditylum_brightwellii.AAC.1
MPGFIWTHATPKEDGKLRAKLQDTEKLPLDVPQPKWLADPTHQTKIVVPRCLIFSNKERGHHKIPRLTACV